ncbi:MAG: sporulation membrane protein YtaF [Provencibacterium sp.]|jgi:putative sporulation protein YtaF|nr:sporulation membrane protein YtaF [Provencibacterium sp.]
MGLTLPAIALVFALCLDSFVASFAFGAQQIRIPPLPAMMISAVCAATLGVSLLIGSLLRPFLPPGLCPAAGFSILLLLGVTRLLDSGIKNLIRRSQSGSARLQFHFMSFQCILRIYADNTAADSDHSQSLSCLEAAPLALALSADSLAAGFGAGIAETGSAAVMTALSFLAGLLLVGLGAVAGRAVAKRTDLNLSWLSGAVLILLAVGKLL